SFPTLIPRSCVGRSSNVFPRWLRSEPTGHRRRSALTADTSGELLLPLVTESLRQSGLRVVPLVRPVGAEQSPAPGRAAITGNRRPGGVLSVLHESGRSCTISTGDSQGDSPGKSNHEPGKASRRGLGPLLLPERAVPRLWPARARQLDRAHALRTAAAPPAPLPHLQAP